MARAGQRPGPLDGDTPQAEELAHWLRALTGGLTVRDLANRFDYGRTQWSDFLKGRKLIPSWLLNHLVTALIPEPVRRDLELQKGQELLRVAEEAAAGKLALATPLPPTSTSPDSVHLRLDEARRAQLAAQDLLRGYERLAFVLLTVIGTLTERCTRLEAERDKRAGASGELEQAGRSLTEADTQLKHVRVKREEAEQVRLDAKLAEAQQLRLLAEQHEQAPSAPGTASTDALPEPVLPPLEEFEQLLRDTAGHLDDLDAEATQVREDLGHPLSGGTEGERVIPGEVVPDAAAEQAFPAGGVVREDGTDNVDNAADLADGSATDLPPGGTTVTTAAETPAAPVDGPPAPSETQEAWTPGGNKIARTPGAGPRQSIPRAWSAERIQLRARLAMDRLLNLDHPQALSRRHQHAFNRGEAGQRAEAARLFAALSEDVAQVLGPNSQLSQASRYHHALNLGEAGLRAEAARLFAALSEDVAQVLGPDHPYPLDIRYQHAFNLGEAGQSAQAAQLLAVLSKDTARFLGPHHPQTLTAAHQYARFEAQQRAV